MLRRTPAIVGSVAIASLCAVQGCSAASSTQASSGSTPTTTADSGTGASSGTSSAPPAGGSSSSAKPSGNPVVAQGPTAPAAGGGASGTFTVPAASSAVQGHGSYQKINSHLVRVEVCAAKVGPAFAVGVEALAYNSDYSKHGTIASVILPETPGQAACTHINLFYTAHLKVFSFIGQGGNITKKSPMKVIY